MLKRQTGSDNPTDNVKLGFVIPEVQAFTKMECPAWRVGKRVMRDTWFAWYIGEFIDKSSRKIKELTILLVRNTNESTTRTVRWWC